MNRYRNLALPGVLVVAGIVALLANLNVIKWESLYRLFDLWPVILVLVGLELMLRTSLPRSTATAVVAAAVVVAIVGALVYVALGPPVPLGERSLDASHPVSGAEKATLDIGFGAADVTVHGASLGETLYRVHVDYAGQAPEVRYDESSHTLSVQDSNQGFRLFAPGGRRTADIGLNQDLAWTVDVAGGATHATLDLVGLRLGELNVSGGANSVVAHLPKPSGTVSIGVSGGASNVTLDRPLGVPVKLHASGGVNSITVDGQHQSGLGDTDFSTRGYDAATDRYEIDVSGGASSVSVGTS
jgi:hypothetical protein